MKRIFCVILAVLATALFTACADGNVPDDDNKSGAGYYLIYNNVEIIPGADVATVTDTLGEPTSYYEAASCAFEGLDKIFTYGSVQISTYPVRDTDKILSVVLLDDANSTPEGITIGSEREEVVAAYGESLGGSGTSMTYSKGNTTLKFLIRDGCVTSIQYHDSSVDAN